MPHLRRPPRLAAPRRPPDQPMGTQQIERKSLGLHTDDCEVTLNVCLGVPGFQGGDIGFHGLRGTAGEGQEDARVPHRLGQAVM